MKGVTNLGRRDGEARQEGEDLVRLHCLHSRPKERKKLWYKLLTDRPGYRDRHR